MTKGILALSLLCCSLGLKAQIMTGSITGAITDPSGSVVAGVAVTLVQVSTNSARHSVTDASGVFLFGGLDGGEYNLTAAKPGFKTYEQKSLILSTGDRIALEHIVLDLGAVNETVSVTASAATV
jgi:hypothetical protein